jgi:hypothetical protein
MKRHNVVGLKILLLVLLATRSSDLGTILFINYAQIIHSL